MYTDCPSCQRQFRIRAVQLSTAGGLVQCGYCGQRFNALERLRDRPLPAGNAAPDRQEAEAGDEIGFEIPASAPEETIAEPRHVPVERADTGGREQPVAGPDTPKPVPEERTAPDDGGLPPELQPEDPGSGARAGRVLWSLGAVLLLLVLAGQLMWFHRDRLLTEYPEFRPWAREVCESLHCEVIRHRDLSAIRLVNRDVRDHPRYENALLVNATIVNRAGEVQPFPIMRLSLFDTEGRLIGYRRFTPGDYLDASIDSDEGMSPEVPVHVVLEVAGPTRGAVSFEFDFLPG